MPRRSLTASTSNPPQSHSTPESSSGAKRGRPPPAPQSTPVSGRSRRARATPRRSQYFTGSDLSSGSSSGSEDSADQSGYEDENASERLSSVPPSEDNDDEYASESSVPARKRQKSTRKQVRHSNSNTPKSASKKGEELWRPGVKTRLGPGTQVVIQKPKPRPAGKTPYKDDTIHPNTLAFLADLAENNEREWLKMHDPDYRTSWNDFMKWLECLQAKIIEIDETVPEMPLKDVVSEPSSDFE